MSYFLSPQALTPGQTLTLEGEEAGHLLKSRRLRAGDVFALQDPAGLRFAAEVVSVQRHTAVIRTREALPVPTLPPVRLTLVLAAVKDKALEYVLQKATELGVADIVLFVAEHSPVTSDELAQPKALARWERILREACKQCDRQFPPSLRTAPGLDAGLKQIGDTALRLVLDPRASLSMAQAMASAEPHPSAAVLIGPEGGLSPEEVAQAERSGYRGATMGQLILRTDTAAIAACTLVLHGGAAAR
ncbi:MAG TPA: RsmE family RNA methyltransferase [bacterium]